jgi:hypothetical protein
MSKPAYFKFWYVYDKTSYKPTHEHQSEIAANNEAERLAKANPGQEFLVLEAKRSFKVESPVKIVELDNPIPF